MFVTHFNALLTGGAATAARRLHEALLHTGTDSRFYYSPKNSCIDQTDPPLSETYRETRWRSERFPKSLIQKVDHLIHRRLFRNTMTRRPTGKEIFTSERGSPKTTFPPANFDRAPTSPLESVIHLHWIARFIDYASFFGSIHPAQPIVWTLHDMNPFSGGCHFSEGCMRFRHGCGRCPQLPKPASNDLSRKTFLAKKQAIAGCNLHIAAPSQWLIEQAKQSQMFQMARSFHHIPYGVHTTDLYPMDREEACGRLGIDPSATIVCFGAMDVKSDRKGVQHLLPALNAIADVPNVQVLVFGRGDLPKTNIALPPMKHVGAINGLLGQRTVYSAADVFVLPSLEDNLPLTGLEAMACATAVLGFNAGGIPDYVREGISGALATVADSQALGCRLRELISDKDKLRSLGQSARKLIEREYSAQREAAAYNDLYATLCSTSAQVGRVAA